MPTGRPAFVRCRRCERALPHQWSDYGGAYDPTRHVNEKAYDVVRTGRTKPSTRRYHKHQILYEYQCAQGHVFWSINGSGDLVKT